MIFLDCWIAVCGMMFKWFRCNSLISLDFTFPKESFLMVNFFHAIRNHRQASHVARMNFRNHWFCGRPIVHHENYRCSHGVNDETNVNPLIESYSQRYFGQQTYIANALNYTATLAVQPIESWKWKRTPAKQQQQQQQHLWRWNELEKNKNI